jgi:hypothetical protein
MPYMRPSEFAGVLKVEPIEVEELIGDGLPTIKGPSNIRLIDLDLGLAWVRKHTDLLDEEDEDEGSDSDGLDEEDEGSDSSVEGLDEEAEGSDVEALDEEDEAD